MPDNPFAAAPAAPSSNPFGAQSQPTAPNATNGAYNPQTEQPQQMIDPNDPRLFEEQNLDPHGDAYAQQPLPTEGKWKAKLKLIGVDDKDKYQGGDFRLANTKKDHLPYFSTGIACTILDPSGKYDGVTVYPEFGGEVGTLVTGKMTASKISTIVQKLGNGPDGRPWYPQGRMNQLSWMKYFVEKVLPSEPSIGIEVQWEGSCPACGTAASDAIKAGQNVQYPARVTGMRSFPAEQDPEKRKAGQAFSPNLQCRVHGTYRGRAVVVNFLRLDEVK